jgi:magnesium chelatase family protein
MVRARVETARQYQLARQNATNAVLKVHEIDKHCKLDEQGKHLLEHAFSRLNISARAYHRILKLARTIADLAASEQINSRHIAEAIQYRRLDRD